MGANTTKHSKGTWSNKHIKKYPTPKENEEVDKSNKGFRKGMKDKLKQSLKELGEKWNENKDFRIWKV